MSRRVAPSALLLVVVLLVAAPAYVAGNRNDPGPDHPVPRAVAAASDYVAVSSARSPRVLGLLLAIGVAIALPALGAWRQRSRPHGCPRPGAALVRLAAPRGPPLFFVASS